MKTALALFAAGLALVACGGDTSQTASSSASASAEASAPCTVAAIMPVVTAGLAKSDTKVTPNGANGDLKCAGGIARITALIAPKIPNPSGPLGSTHLVLLEARSGQWVIANDDLCDASGNPKKTIPAELGHVCGIQ